MISGSGESGLDYLKRLRRHWLLGVGVFLWALVISVLAIGLIPNKYAARLKVAVKNERVDPVVGSDKQTQGIFYVNDVSEPRVNTEIQLMTGSKVLAQVVERCHLADAVKGNGQPALWRKEMALRELGRDLTVAAVRNSNVIEVSYESTSPLRAAEVVSAVWGAYTSASRVMHGAPGSLEFFEALSASYDGRLAAANADLARFRKTHDVVSLPEEQSLSLTNAAHLSSQIGDSAAAAEKSAAAARDLRREMNAMPASVERGRRSLPNQALVQQLTSLLVTLRNQRTDAALRYQPGDRLLRGLDTQIAQTEQSLALANKGTADEVSTAANPDMDVARTEYIRAAAENAGAQAQTAALDRQMRKDRARLTLFAAEAAEYKQLVQRVAEMDELATGYHKRTEEARLEYLLDEQQMSNLALLEEPYVPVLPSSPKRGLLLMLSAFWSGLLALVAAAVAEGLTRRVASPLELEQKTELPLLASVPRPAPRLAEPRYPSLYEAMQRPDMAREMEMAS